MNKKAIILASALVAACGCMKIQEDNTRPEIFFNAVAHKSAATKAAEKDGPVEGAFYGYDCPEFTVFLSYLSTGTWPADISSAKAYAKATCSSDPDLEIWYSNPATYWPVSGTLTFVGFSPASVASEYDTKTGVLTCSDYSISAQKDIMYSCAADAANLSSATDNYKPAEGVDKQDTPGVPIIFRHALSQVSVTVDAASSLTPDVMFKLTSLRLTEDATKSLAVNQGQTVAATAVSWRDEGDKKYDHTLVSSATTIKKNGTKFISDSNSEIAGNQGFLIFPQDASKPKLYISYEQYQNSGLTESQYNALADKSGLIAEDNVVWAKAGSVTDKAIDLTASNLTRFVAGKKYILNLTLSAETISYSPSVYDWTEPAVETDLSIPPTN